MAAHSGQIPWLILTSAAMGRCSHVLPTLARLQTQHLVSRSFSGIVRIKFMQGFESNIIMGRKIFQIYP